MKTLNTEIIIHASIETVWNILTDFDVYPEWNPFIKSFTGNIREYERFEVQLHPPGGKPMTFKPRCLALKPHREFRWLGHLGIKGLFDGEHLFELESLKNGDTRFSQSEQFRGILVPLIWRMVGESTLEGFVAMNQALKQRAENASE